MTHTEEQIDTKLVELIHSVITHNTELSKDNIDTIGRLLDLRWDNLKCSDLKRDIEKTMKEAAARRLNMSR